MGQEEKVTLGFFEKLKLIKEVINLILVLLAIVGITYLLNQGGALLNQGGAVECVTTPKSWLEIVIGASSILALSLSLSIPILPATAFGAFMWLLTKIWMCSPSGGF